VLLMYPYVHAAIGFDHALALALSHPVVSVSIMRFIVRHSQQHDRGKGVPSPWRLAALLETALDSIESWKYSHL